MSTVLESLGLDLGERRLINIFGPPMVGKTILACSICRDYVGSDGSAVIYGFEHHYAEDEYVGMVRRFLPQKSYINILSGPEEIYRLLPMARKLSGRTCIVLDSISALALKLSSRLASSGITDPRAVSARVIPALLSTASIFREIVNERNALGIIITHAGSTAGAYRYRALLDYRPSMARRIAHMVSHEIFIDMVSRDERVAIVTASRTRPLAEGSEARFRISSRGVEVVEKKVGKK